MSGRLADKVALITGTGGGQGRAAALAFTAEGARVVGCDVNVDGNEETVRLVEAVGGTMTGMQPIDLGDAEASKRWIEEAAACYGGVDVLYNNAASVRFSGSIPDVPLEDWHYTIRNELDLVFYATKFVWPHLVARGGGVIINTASATGLRANRHLPAAAHAAAKAGVIGLTRQAAAEGGAAGIRVVSISPGPIEGPATTAQFQDSPEVYDQIAASLLLGRWGQPDEIAQVAVFLASNEASFITGANYVVDGGRTTI